MKRNENQNHKPVPYSLDAKSPSDLHDLVNDKAFKRSLQDHNRAFIHVHSPNSYNTDIPEEILDNVKEHLDSFLMNARPEILQSLGFSIENFMELKDDPQKRQDEIQNFTALLQHNAQNGTYTALSAMPFMSREFQSGGPRARRGSYLSQSDGPEVLLVPSESTPAEYLQGLFLNSDHARLAQPLGGTREEWAAIITWHELEHSSDDRQIALLDYFREVKDEYGLTLNDSVLFQEIEADCGAFNALEQHLSPCVQEGFIALRIASTFNNDLFHYGMRKEGAATTHSTGFHLAEYHHTGHMPDYYDMQDNVRGFYELVYDKVSEMTQEMQGVLPRSEYFEMGDIISNPDVIVTVVRDMQNQGIFSPAQEQIALQFLSAYNTLGIGPAADTLGVIRDRYSNKLEHIDRIKELLDQFQSTQNADHEPENKTDLESGAPLSHCTYYGL